MFPFLQVTATQKVLIPLQGWVDNAPFSFISINTSDTVTPTGVLDFSFFSPPFLMGSFFFKVWVVFSPQHYPTQKVFLVLPSQKMEVVFH